MTSPNVALKREASLFIWSQEEVGGGSSVLQSPVCTVTYL